jgi:hypothetical protein
VVNRPGALFEGVGTSEFFILKKNFERNEKRKEEEERSESKANEAT